MKKLYKGLAAAFLLLFFTPAMYGQTVGIGTDFPTATLDIVSTTAIPGMRVTRSLTPSASTTAAVEINDDSDWGAQDIYYSGTNTFGVASYIENTSVGVGILINNLNPAAPFEALSIFQDGAGPGVVSFMNSSVSPALYAFHVAGPLPFASILSDISFLPGTSNGVEIDMEDADGSGFFAYNMDIVAGTGSATQGDGWMHDAFVFSETPPLVGAGSTTYYGGALGADQYGNSVGIFMRQHGTSAANSVFINSDATTTHPVIEASNAGVVGVIVAENTNDAPGAPLDVGQFVYLGTDVTNDHTGIYSQAVNDDGFNGWGVGAYNVGGYFGTVGQMGSPNGMAGIYSADDLGANGAKMFIIDHPLEPETKMLRHFSMESNEILNVYQGTATIGRTGSVEIELPDYFEAINVNFSYQLTAIGTPRQPYIAKEVQNNTFAIAGKPNSRVSWMVIANRNDAYVRSNPDRVVAEVDKRPQDVGKYLNPASYGLSPERGILYRNTYEPIKQPTRPKPDPNSRTDVTPQKVDKTPLFSAPQVQRRIKADRPTLSPEERMEIRKEIKTWDELR